MATSIYNDKRIEPSEKMLSDDLAGSKKYLECIGKFINIEYGDLTSEWKFSNKKSGWILKLLNENGMFYSSYHVKLFSRQHSHLEINLLI